MAKTWTLITPDGNETIIAKDRKVTLQELYKHIGCDMVQAVPLGHGRTLWCDEEAKLKDELPAINPKATRMLAQAGGIPGDVVLGNVIIEAIIKEVKG